MLFKIDIALDAFSFSGLQALDFCRRLRITDQTNIRRTMNGSYTRDVEVSESFARRYAKDFSDASGVRATVSNLDLLVPGDLVEIEHEVLGWNPEITDERVRELWEASN